MKSYLLIMLGAFLFLGTDTTAQHTLSIKVENIKNSKGQIRAALYRSADNFPDKSKAYRGESVKAQQGSVTIKFRNLPDGKYAIALFHDENSNSKMDYNMLGIPKEAYGFGNNAPARFWPPSFEKAAVIVKKSRQVSVHL